jgi:hypothetical protein
MESVYETLFRYLGRSAPSILGVFTGTAASHHSKNRRRPLPGRPGCLVLVAPQTQLGYIVG